MSMPEIPENKHRPSKCCTVIDLLESIALEEIALSHLLNAEAEKIQAFVGKDLDFPLNPSIDEIILFNKTSIDFIDSILMKEWLLLNKLKKVTEINISDNCKSCCNCYNCCNRNSSKDKRD